jgi:hypothetical protein
MTKESTAQTAKKIVKCLKPVAEKFKKTVLTALRPKCEKDCCDKNKKS